MTASRTVAPGVVVAHVKGALNVSTGALAGEHNAIATLVLVKNQNDWRIAAFHNMVIR